MAATSRSKCVPPPGRCWPGPQSMLNGQTYETTGANRLRSSVLRGGSSRHRGFPPLHFPEKPQQPRPNDQDGRRKPWREGQPWFRLAPCEFPQAAAVDLFREFRTSQSLRKRPRPVRCNKKRDGPGSRNSARRQIEVLSAQGCITYEVQPGENPCRSKQQENNGYNV